MPSLGTLVTVVTADTSGFTAGMNTVAQQAQQFEQKIAPAKSATSGWGKELDAMGHKFTSLGGIMKIGLGLGTAKAILSEVHHIVTNLGGGFLDAAAAGGTFGESMKDALRSTLGLSTSAKELAENLKHVVEAEKAFGTGTTPTSITGSTTRAQRIEALKKSRDEISAALKATQEQAAPSTSWKAQYASFFLGPFATAMTGIQGDVGARKRIPDLQRRLEVINDELNKQLAESATHTETSSPLAYAIRRALMGAANLPGQGLGAVTGFFGGGIQTGLSGIGGQFLQGIHDLKMALDKTASAQAKTIKEETESPAEKAMRLEKEATNLFNRGDISRTDYIRRIAQIREGLGDTRGTVSIGGLEDLHNQLQSAALKGSNPQIDAVKRAIEAASKIEADKLDAILTRMNPLIWGA